MMAAPVMPPSSWAKTRMAARTGVMAPTRARPSETAGLKRPPDTRKKTQAQTQSEKPKPSEMKSSCEVLVTVSCVMETAQGYEAGDEHTSHATSRIRLNGPDGIFAI